MFVLTDCSPPQWSEQVKSMSRQEWQRAPKLSVEADFFKGMDLIQWDLDRFKE